MVPLFLIAGKNSNGRVCCLVKCSVVTRKPPASSLQTKGASSEIIPQTQQQCEKRLSLIDKLDQSEDSKLKKTFPMPSCSYQVDKDLNTSASPTSMVGFKSYFSNKYLARPAPRSAPASNQTSPSHHSSHCRFKGSKLPTTAGLMPIYTSALKTLITDAAKCQIAEDDDREQRKITPDASEQREVKTGHHSAGDTFENNTSPSRSPKLSGKSSPGRLQVKRSRRHTIANGVSTTSYPDGGFRYMAGFSSAAKTKKTIRDGKSSSTPEPSPPPGRSGNRNKGSPKRSNRDKSGQSGSPKL